MHKRRIAVTLLLGLVMVACSESTAPPKPAASELAAAIATTAQVATVVTLPAFTVKDGKGAAMANQPITVTVSGGGSLSGVPAKTLAGATPLGSWTLGPKSGAQTVTISSGSLTPVTVSVTALAGPPAKMTAVTTPSAVSVVGTVLATPASLQILDAFDNPADGAVVAFVAAGGGTLAASSATVSTTGTVAVPAWTLGTIRGTNTVTASIGTLSTVFTVVAQSDVPAAISVAQGNAQRVLAGTAAPVLPQVRVVDRFGNGVPRQNVAFSVTAGAGSITGANTVQSDTSGLAAIQGWTMGRRNVAQRLHAAVGAIATDLDATIQSDFNIEVRFVGAGMTEDQKTLFRTAAERISAFIVGDVAAVTATNFDLNAACGVSGQPLLNETIDDLVIYASVTAIDGPGQVLARAGACGFRGTASRNLPGVGMMQFDVADLQTLAGAGSLEDVITHEMLHVVGLSSTFWNINGYLFGYPGADPRYFGASATAACRTLGGTATCATSIPIENTGGSGTAGSHWRETTFTNELMTGYLNAGANLLSRMSIAGFADIGYTVNTAAADSYSLTSALRSTPSRLLSDTTWEELIVRGLPLDGGTPSNTLKAGVRFP